MEFSGLNEEQWNAIKHYFSEPQKRGRGKPHAPWRKVVNTIFWVIETKGKWSACPEGELWASKSSAHRWFRRWQESGFWDCITSALKQMDSACESASCASESIRNDCPALFHAAQTSPLALPERREPAESSCALQDCGRSS